MTAVSDQSLDFYLTVWPASTAVKPAAGPLTKVRRAFVNRYDLGIIHVRQSNDTEDNRIEVEERLVLSFRLTGLGHD